MHRIIRTGLILGSFVSVMGVSRAQAQVEEPVLFQTTFPFTVSGHEMPAGKYELRPVGEQPGVLELTNRAANRGLFFEVHDVETRAGAAAPASEIVFLRQGADYVLRDVWVAGEDIGAEASGRLPEAMRAARDAGTATDLRVAAVTTRHASRASRS